MCGCLDCQFCTELPRTKLITSRVSEVLRVREFFLSACQDSTHNLVPVQEGTVAEQGTHSELMTAQGLYHELWTKQEVGSVADLQPVDGVSRQDSPPSASTSILS